MGERGGAWGQMPRVAARWPVAWRRGGGGGIGGSCLNLTRHPLTTPGPRFTSQAAEPPPLDMPPQGKGK